MFFSVIIPELVLRQVDREVLSIHTMTGAVQPFGVAPEPLQTVDVGRAVNVRLGVVNRHMLAESAQVVLTCPRILVQWL